MAVFLISSLTLCAPEIDHSFKPVSGHTYYDIPEWSQDAIWYQIFPDRFRNGDPGNDPDVESLTGTWPYANPEGWQVSPWASDWYKLQPWEVDTGEDFWYNAQLRRYGGDIQGIIDELDYLKDLGVNALYLNPVFESPSSHKYGCTMWHHVDNNFGPDPVGDEQMWDEETPGDPSTWKWTSADRLFLKLVEEVHKRDMRIIIDGVFNHTGIPFWAIEDIRKNGAASEYASWFSITSYDDPDTPEDELNWQGWYGVHDLPELAEDENGPVQGVKDHLHAVVKRWMDPNGDGDPADGIDGWRLDVAEMVSQNFWREFRTWTRDINPESYLVGEVWWQDYGKDKMFLASDWVEGDIFDAVMNYRFADAMLRSMVDEKRRIEVSELDELLGLVRKNYRKQNQYALMNLFNSHDTERLSNMLLNPDRTIDHGGSSRDQREFDLGKPGESDRDVQRTMLLFQYTYPGAPHIYYGEEVGMWGADDPDCRKPMIWNDLNYETEVAHPYGEPFGPFTVEVNRNLKDYYSSLNQLRNQEVALRRGMYRTILADDEKSIFAFERQLGKDRFIAVFNLGEIPWTPQAQIFGARGVAGWQAVFDSGAGDLSAVQPGAGRLYKNKNQ